jgi:hypothetical protein
MIRILALLALTLAVNSLTEAQVHRGLHCRSLSLAQVTISGV